MPISRSRLVAITAAGTGLVAGLALGATSLASASTSTPSKPSSGTAAASPGHTGKAHQGHRRAHQRRIGDLVTDVTGSTISFDTPRGAKTVTVNSTTTYARGTTAASLADVRKGEIVRIGFVDPKATALVAKHVRIELAHEAGYVQSVSGGTVTIIDRGGFTRTILESSATLYRTDGTAGKATDIAAGKFLRAVGNVAQDGSTLDASRIWTGKPAGRHQAPAPSSNGTPGTGSAG